jgi:sugar lactone lactonase YvrE
MRWLWKDWPKPVAKGNSMNDYLSNLLIPGEDWEVVGQGYQFTEGTASDKNGVVYYQDIPTSKTYRVDLNGKLTPLNVNAKRASATAFGSDGLRYTVAGATRQILSYNSSGKESVIADSIAGNDITITNSGNKYVTVPDGTNPRGKVYLIRTDGEKLVVDEGLRFPNGVALAPDQTQLYVTESATHWVWIYKIKNDGTLAYKQRFGWLHSPDSEDNAWPDGLKCDTAGRIFVATRLGIQVMDQLGRVEAIIPIPASKGQASNVCFGGADFNYLYVSAVDKVFRRKLNTRGANSFDKPIRPANPKL